MLLDTRKEWDIKKAKERLDELIEKGAKIELIEKKKIRSVNQNKYLHAILTIFAVEYGETINYVKDYFFKSLVNHELFVYERENKITGEFRQDLKSTSELNTEQMTLAIERFRNFAADNNIYIMDADEYKENYFLVKQMEEENKTYL